MGTQNSQNSPWGCCPESGIAQNVLVTALVMAARDLAKQAAEQIILRGVSEELANG
jgi:hypothetical protein